MTANKPSIILSPVPYVLHRVKGHAHVGFPEHLGILNRLTYSLSNLGYASTVYDAQKYLPEKTSYSRIEILRNLVKKKIMYSVSPTLFPRPEYWPPQAEVVGFLEKEKSNQINTNSELVEFLQRHPKPLLLTFGSMVNAAPREISAFLYGVMQESGIPTIVNIASGGLMRLEAYEKNENFLFVEGIPYDSVMEKVYAVIHHGGAGTTHTALKHGCPTLIVPHIIDQFIWNERVFQLGAGPKGISMNKLPSEKFIALVKDLYNNPAYAAGAKEIAHTIQLEKSENMINNFIKKEID
jgi:UDP:flavonoid glycosyltransferase YjiC (YdhE family)